MIYLTDLNFASYIYVTVKKGEWYDNNTLPPPSPFIDIFQNYILSQLDFKRKETLLKKEKKVKSPEDLIKIF